MSLTTRIAMLCSGGLLAALGLAVLAAWLIGDALGSQWADRQEATASAIADDVGRLPDDPQARRSAAERRFMRGDLIALSSRAADGTVLFERRREQKAGGPPAREAVPPDWFIDNVLPPPAASVLTLEGSGRGGSVMLAVEADGADLRRLAWMLFLRATACIAALVVAVVAAALWLAQRRHRLLATTLKQALALERLQFIEIAEPYWPGWRELTRAMNAVVRRLREQVQAQAEQVAQLQRQAQTDAVTGLPRRSFFLSRLADLLVDARLPATALLLVRVPDLDVLNERHGRDAADRLLSALGDVLLTYMERIPGAAAGRLSGQDFALALPAAGAANETATALQAAMAAAPAARLSGARVVVAGCDGLRGLAPGKALAAADAALALAESAGDGTPVVERAPETGAPGARTWREQLIAALDESRVRLAAFPVVDSQGGLIHLECPLRVQLEPAGEYHVARRWLAMAARARLTPRIDLAAAQLALAAIAADGRPRCVHVAPRSLTSPGFARALQARLRSAGPHAALLSIEWSELPEEAAVTMLHDALREAVPGWRRAGVRVGVEHAGASPRGLPALKEIGIDYVKVDARHLQGLSEHADARSYVESLVNLIHGLDLQALAEGVAEERDLALLWRLGFDGATGAAVGLGAVGSALDSRIDMGAGSG